MMEKNSTLRFRTEVKAFAGDDLIVPTTAERSLRFSSNANREREAKEKTEVTPLRARMVRAAGQPSKLRKFGRMSAVIKFPSRWKNTPSGSLGTLLLRDRCSIVLCSTTKRVTEAIVVA